MHNNNQNFQLIDIIKKLRKPAGDDPKFSNPQSILENYNSFIKSVHNSYKEIHFLILMQMIEIEKKLKEFKRVKSNKHIVQLLKFNMAIYRRINDSIAWLMLSKQRHILKRLCFYRNRGFLIDQNPDSILETLAELNSDAFSLAIWTDATTFIDVGDIFMVNKLKGDVRFIEVKEGKVNEAMIPYTEKCDRALYLFLQKYGEKGKQQLIRYAKQMKKDTQVIDIIKKEEGIDPLTGLDIKVSESITKDEYYDQTLNNGIDRLEKRDESILSIDNCLWILITKKLYSLCELQKRIKGILENGSHKESLIWQNKMFNFELPYPLFSLQEGLNNKISMPIFLRDIKDEYIEEIINGKLKIFLFFDWYNFGKIIESCGGKLIWSSIKLGRREKTKKKEYRSFILSDQIPILKVGKNEIYLSGSHLIKMIFDGIRPRVAAAQLIEAYRGIGNIV